MSVLDLKAKQDQISKNGKILTSFQKTIISEFGGSGLYEVLFMTVNKKSWPTTILDSTSVSFRKTSAILKWSALS